MLAAGKSLEGYIGRENGSGVGFSYQTVTYLECWVVFD